MTSNRPEPQSQKKKVMVVDDEPAIRSMVVFQLSEAGFETFEAVSGEDALKKLAASPVDVVISDVRMPHGNGPELLDTLKKRNAERPALIFMSGFSDISTAEAYARGAEGLIAKPIESEQLIQLIHRAARPQDEKWRDADDEIDVAFSIDFDLENLTDAFEDGTLAIGRGGMFVALSDNFPRPLECTRFCINYAKDGQTASIEGVGVVRWVRYASEPGLRAGIGLEFKTLSAQCLPMVHQHIAANKVVAYIPLGTRDSDEESVADTLVGNL